MTPEERYREAEGGYSWPYGEDDIEVPRWVKIALVCICVGLLAGAVM